MGKSSQHHSYVRCGSCRHSVFVGTRRCPHCGRLLRWDLKPLAIWLVAAILGALLSYALVQWLESVDAGRGEAELATPYNS